MGLGTRPDPGRRVPLRERPPRSVRNPPRRAGLGVGCHGRVAPERRKDGGRTCGRCSHAQARHGAAYGMETAGGPTQSGPAPLPAACRPHRPRYRPHHSLVRSVRVRSGYRSSPPSRRMAHAGRAGARSDRMDGSRRVLRVGGWRATSVPGGWTGSPNGRVRTRSS